VLSTFLEVPRQDTLSESRRHRPLGVTIIAAILGIEGILELLGGVLILMGVFAVGRAISGHGHTTTSTVVDVVGIVLAIIPLVIGVLTFIFAVGLWLLKRWAFWLVVIIEVISLVRHALEFTQATHPPVALIVADMIIPVVVLLYFLVDPNVCAAFFGRRDLEAAACLRLKGEERTHQSLGIRFTNAKAYSTYSP